MNMNYFKYNIANKLNKSIVNNKNYQCFKINNSDSVIKNLLIIDNNRIDKKGLVSVFLVKILLFNFLIFFSKNLINNKKNKRNFVIFLKFYNYFNFFFLNNKMLSYKKYFFKKKREPFYLNKFYLNTKQVNFDQGLNRLKEKKISFYKKNIWTKRRFRKKNILIFNKKFFKLYFSNRFNTFLVDSLLPFFKTKRIRHFRAIKKKMFGLFFKRYYYLFLYKRYTFNTYKKRYKKKFLSFDFYYKTYAKIFVNKKFFAKRRRKNWRQVYFVRRKRFFSRMLFTSFETKAFDLIFMKKFSKKKSPLHAKFLLKDYLVTFALKLADRYSTDKKFFKRFFSRRKFFRRLRNVIYYYKWKPKIINFYSLKVFKRYRGIRKFLLSLVCFKLFFRKILWRRRKFSKSFTLFFLKNFFFDNCFLYFNVLLKSKILFHPTKKRMRRITKYKKKRRLTYYNKRRRRRLMKKKFKRKIARFFIILLFFKFMKKHKNPEKIFVFRNSFILSNLKKIKLKMLSLMLFDYKKLYFKNGKALNDFNNISYYKEDAKIISLIRKK